MDEENSKVSLEVTNVVREIKELGRLRLVSFNHIRQSKLGG